VLLYLVKHSRPDIANAVSELTKCMDKGSPMSYHEMLRVVRFVLRTKNLGLKSHPNIDFIALLWELLLLSNSDHAGDKLSRLLIRGFICSFVVC
jgi:hypothetical protein